MTRRPTVRVAVLAAVCACVACSRPAQEPSPAPAVIVTSAEGPVRVRVEIDRDEARTVDRVSVRVVLTVSPTVPPPLVDFDVESQGWTIERETIETPAVDGDGMIVRERHWILSPGLAGEYLIPSCAVVWTDAAGEKRELRTAPIPVRISSVLDEGDTLELEPPTSIDGRQNGEGEG